MSGFLAATVPRHLRYGRLKRYDGMIYATGWLVGWPALMFLVAELLRNLGKFTSRTWSRSGCARSRCASPPRSAAS